jgi:hypothetical protein
MDFNFSLIQDGGEIQRMASAAIRKDVSQSIMIQDDYRDDELK